MRIVSIIGILGFIMYVIVLYMIATYIYVPKLLQKKPELSEVIVRSTFNLLFICAVLIIILSWAIISGMTYLILRVYGVSISYVEIFTYFGLTYFMLIPRPYLALTIINPTDKLLTLLMYDQLYITTSTLVLTYIITKTYKCKWYYATTALLLSLEFVYLLNIMLRGFGIYLS